MEKIWLKSYPAGVPAEINVDQYASLREVLEDSCARFASRPAYSCMGRTITFTELDRLSAAFGAFLQGRGPGQGRARRADDAQHPPVSGVPVRRPQGGLHRRQRQPALHAARARASAQRQRRGNDRRGGKFRAHGGRSYLQNQGQARRRDLDRRNAGSQGRSRRLRAAAREEDDPRVGSSRGDAAFRRAWRGPQAQARARRARP